MSDDNKNKIELKDHWFWSSVLDNKATYVQIFLASIFINVFGLGSAFYIMTVYDRGMPNNAMTTLVALTIGMAVIILFDFITKLLRTFFIDIAGKKIDQNVSDILFKNNKADFLDSLIKYKGILRKP